MRCLAGLPEDLWVRQHVDYDLARAGLQGLVWEVDYGRMRTKSTPQTSPCRYVRNVEGWGLRKKIFDYAVMRAEIKVGRQRCGWTR